MELDSAVVREAQHGRAPRSVAARGEDAYRRQTFLQFEADAGAGKICAPRALGVAEQLERRGRVERLLELGGELGFGLLDLGPWRVQQVVRQAVDAGCHARGPAAAVGDEP